MIKLFLGTILSCQNGLNTTQPHTIVDQEESEFDVIQFLSDENTETVVQLFAETRLAPTIDGTIVKSQPRETYASGKLKYVLRLLYLIFILAQLFGVTEIRLP